MTSQRNRLVLRAGAPVLLLGACVETTTRPLPPDLAPRPVREVRSWRVTEASATRGRLVLLRIEDPQAPLELYRVENDKGQWVGWIDGAGRVFRREPFATESVLVGTTTVAEGVGLLLHAQSPVVLAENPAREPAHTQVPATRSEPR